ncbi:MAG: hypothetical protein M1832_002023 [Thelocarpon impressellum]|nr:MAG: hypothetical protein M1832_002023 [Thelocarpon impressellum]
MTEVLCAPGHSDSPAYFSPPSLRRPSSQASFLAGYPDSCSRSQARAPHLPADYVERVVHSAPSSAPSSPLHAHHDFSHSSSFPSTPASSLSLNTKGDDEDDQIYFPSYDEPALAGPAGPAAPAGALPADASLEPAESSTISPASENSSAAGPTADAARPHSPDFTIVAEDDTAVRSQPSRHVDYLSHDWKEEDIWSSWRHIVSRRRLYTNAARLENASWRTWAKSKYRLKTVSPETLNWLKDCDVTWLYGPLQTGSTRSLLPSSTPGGSRLSKSNSFLDKKPILKKRSMSEIMLQRSISASSLLKQAAAAVQAQQGDGPTSDRIGRPGIGRAASDFISSSFASRSASDEGTSALPSASSSGLQTPSTGEKRHIHFNDKVEQCIAVDVKDGDDDDDDDGHYPAIDDGDDQSSDDGVVMMKRSSSKARLSKRSTPRNSFSGDGKTIAMLPSTTLKYREDALDDAASEGGRLGRSWTSRLSPSPSQETLRPSKPSANFLIDDEDDDEDMSWEPSRAFAARPGSHLDPREPLADAPRHGEHGGGLRRTPSGMFMPYEEDEDDVVAAGLFGRVVDTVNTAKDIAHVIWNVGWRR